MNFLVSYSPTFRLQDTHLITNDPGYTPRRRAQINGRWRLFHFHNIAAEELFSVVQSKGLKEDTHLIMNYPNSTSKEIAPSRESKNFKKIPREVIVSYRTHRYYWRNALVVPFRFG